LILPLLAISATAATDLFNLKPSVAAFSAAMMSLGRYYALQLIESCWRQRVEIVAHSRK